MKKIGVVLLSCSTVMVAQAQLIDDFSGSLSPYTATTVLYSGGTAPATSTLSFSDSTGALEADMANLNNTAVQGLFLRDDYSLAVGQMLSVTVNWALGSSQDLGLCVASTATPPAASTNPLGNTRTSLSYAFIGIRGISSHIVSSGFDGATALSTQQSQPGSGTTTSLFIDRTSATTFDMGYATTSINGGAPTILTTYTLVNNPGVGTAIGFYSDMRANGSIGFLDDLTISPIPEPTAMALCGLGGFLGLFGWMRRKK